MEKDVAQSIFNKFVDDKFTDAEEELHGAFEADRDTFLEKELDLEPKETETKPEETKEDE